MRVFMAFILMIASFYALPRDFHGVDKERQKIQSTQYSKALSMALDKMIQSGIAVDNSSIFISRQKNFIVVHFSRKINNFHAGGASVVYDPSVNSIIYIKGSD